MQRAGHSDTAMSAKYTHPKIGEIFEDRFSFMKVAEGEEAGA